ncbi:MAG TPA: transcriptional regulator, partial [Treponema sp.]|nr:transcriptional regulator [Treponema sp.]
MAQILELLQSGKTYTAKQIAATVAEGTYRPRTIQRDIEYMRDTLKISIESNNLG